MADKKITVSFYANELGTEPVRVWLKSLDKTDRTKIGEYILAVETDWPVGMPVCRPLGQGLYEVRVPLKDRIARVLFAIEGRWMVVLHGFIKKSQSTPKEELELARRRLRSVRRQG